MEQKVASGPFLPTLAVLSTAALGAPQVWDALSRRDVAPELVFYPVLGVVLAHLALRRARG